MKLVERFKKRMEETILYAQNRNGYNHSAPSQNQKIPIPASQVEQVARHMKFSREWFCTGKHNSPVRLKIRSREEKQDGPSNFAGVFPQGHPVERLRGHSVIPSGMLNWNGLAEERGWNTHPKVLCPACKAGMSLANYKARNQK